MAEPFIESDILFHYDPILPPLPSQRNSSQKSQSGLLFFMSEMVGFAYPVVLIFIFCFGVYLSIAMPKYMLISTTAPKPSQPRYKEEVLSAETSVFDPTIETHPVFPSPTPLPTKKPIIWFQR